MRKTNHLCKKKRQEEEEEVITAAAGATGFVPQITTLWFEIDTWAVGIFWQLIIGAVPLKSALINFLSRCHMCLKSPGQIFPDADSQMCRAPEQQKQLIRGEREEM